MRTITVRGVGNVSAKPDYITISMTIETLSKDYEEAMTEAARRIEQLQNAAARAGCEAGSLKTTSFHVDTRYENIKDPQGNYVREFTGYACTYRLKLAFDFSGKQLAAVISSLAGSGAKPELSIAFTVKDPSKVSEALLASAAENAQAKAEILCRASGSELGQLISIDYNWNEPNILSPTSYDLGENCMPVMAMRKSFAPDIVPEDINVRDTAAFVWEII